MIDLLIGIRRLSISVWMSAWKVFAGYFIGMASALAGVSDVGLLAAFATPFVCCVLTFVLTVLLMILIAFFEYLVDLFRNRGFIKVRLKIGDKTFYLCIPKHLVDCELMEQIRRVEAQLKGQF